MWTRTRCIAGAGRSPRSPGTWDMTARPSAPTCSGSRVAGQRARTEADPFEPFVGYCRERLAEDPHLWATTLFDELLELGYDALVSDVHPPAAGPRAASGVRAVPPGTRPAGGGDRAPAG